jgi:MarR-like DNA-binding transcriptional regulator SgrR of sgrS sRNA
LRQLNCGPLLQCRQGAAARALRLVSHGISTRSETQPYHPQCQMIDAEELSRNGSTWVFRLLPGLKFHDGVEVVARDGAASINRRAARDQI